MGLVDRIKQQTETTAGKAKTAAQQAKTKIDESGVVDKAKDQASSAGAAAKERLGEFQVKHLSDPLFRDLGMAVYAQRSGRGTPEVSAAGDRLVAELARIDAEEGSIELEFRTNPGRGVAG